MFVRVRVAPRLLLLPTAALAHWVRRIALAIGSEEGKLGIGRLANPLRDIQLADDALRRVDFKVLDPIRKFYALGSRCIDVPAREIVSA
jgi:hypothetical protein